MAGRINDEDIAAVRDRARIDDIVSGYVALRPAGAGTLKGLCPFHDEKTPSFQVTPSRGFYYCFGCGEGGDVIAFVQKINNLTFVEAVQQLADKVGIVLRMSEDGKARSDPGLRVRIMQANEAAAEFFHEQLFAPDAAAARQMLDERGFDPDAARTFGVGYSPRGGRDLHRYLSGKGFDDQTLVRAGLIRENGGWDFFQGRTMWPIRDSASSVLGFGARRLFDTDRLPAKYINTPETPVYKKSHVLYGLDLARKSIGQKSQAVIVEGYTDVMAAHLAGVNTAVATCGTAFGEDHARLLRRLMVEGTEFHGEVIFTFDGDAAGQKAALRVYDFDHDFTTQTYVAVEPHGWDPCDLRMNSGDAAVRDLIGRRIPLYMFVMSNVVAKYDLDRADGRLAALRAAAPLAKSVRDRGLVNGYVNSLAQLVGMDIDEVRREIRRASTRVTDGPRAQSRDRQTPPEAVAEPVGAPTLPWPPADHPGLAVERGTLRLMLQYPTLFDSAWNSVTVDDFTHPTYRAVFAALSSVPWTPQRWAEKVTDATGDPVARQLEIALLVEPGLRSDPDEHYASAYTAQLHLASLTRAINEWKSKLQRTNPVNDPAAHHQMFTTLMNMEAQRKQLQALAFGAGGL